MPETECVLELFAQEKISECTELQLVCIVLLIRNSEKEKSGKNKVTYLAQNKEGSQMTAMWVFFVDQLEGPFLGVTLQKCMMFGMQLQSVKN